MILVGVAFILFASLVEFLGTSVVQSGFIVGIGCAVAGLLVGERIRTRP